MYSTISQKVVISVLYLSHDLNFRITNKNDDTIPVLGQFLEHFLAQVDMMLIPWSAE